MRFLPLWWKRNSCIGPRRGFTSPCRRFVSTPTRNSPRLFRYVVLREVAMSGQLAGATETWRYTRGSQSVRLVRHGTADGCERLVVYGPGTEVSTYQFANVAECMKRQAEIENNLL